jgi:hypothetical protein
MSNGFSLKKKNPIISNYLLKVKFICNYFCTIFLEYDLKKNVKLFKVQFVLDSNSIEKLLIKQI